MHFLKTTLVLVGLLVLSLTIFAQNSGISFYNEKQIESDQEMSPVGVETDEFKGIHIISAAIHGVRGANGIVYWVDKDSRILSAYRAKELLWRVNVADAFKPNTAQPKIEKLIFSTEVVFVVVSTKGFAEVDRKSGRLESKVWGVR